MMNISEDSLLAKNHYLVFMKFKGSPAVVQYSGDTYDFIAISYSRTGISVHVGTYL